MNKNRTQNQTKQEIRSAYDKNKATLKKTAHALLLSLMLGSSLALIGCNPTHKSGHHEDASAKEEHGHEHGNGGVAITHYTDKTELFVEFPYPVKGVDLAFAAHMTALGNEKNPHFQAINEGKLIVVLSGGGQPEERTEIGISSTPGIFRPVLKPKYAGQRQLRFELITPQLQSMHDLGNVLVYADQKAAQAQARHEEEESGIKFTKELQWKIAFANAPAVEREIRESIAVTATVKPRASGEAQLTAPVAGLLKAGSSGFPQLGNQVKAGQVLAYLLPKLGGDTDAAALTLALQRGKIELERAQQERTRLEALFAAEAVPEKRVLEARNQERLAQAELQAASSRLGGYSGAKQGAGLPIVSPINGTIVAVNGADGGAISEGTVVVQVASLDKLWLEAYVPENEAGRISKPTGAYIHLTGSSENNNTGVQLEVGRNARLIAFGGMVNPSSRTIPAILEFTPNSENGTALFAGMNVRTQLYTGRASKSIAIPSSAVVDDGGQTVVFIQKEGEAFERRIVQLGTYDGAWVAVKSGIALGERVVSIGAYQVRLAATAPAAMGHGHAH